MERAHHLTAALYFGIAALEAFINERMREHLKPTKSQDQIFDFLRKGTIKEKLKKWPKLIVGEPLEVDAKAMQLIVDFVGVRDDLTHPKTQGHEIYSQLDTIHPTIIVSTVAEFIVRYYEAAGTTFPYWVFGWNYLNPRPDSYEIIIINDQQFIYSLRSLGLFVDAARHSNAAQPRYLGSFANYCEVRDGLAKTDRCEPKQAQFPYAPVLCRRWWEHEHQQMCGCVTRDALQRAIDIDNAYDRRVEPTGGIKGWFDRIRRTRPPQ